MKINLDGTYKDIRSFLRVGAGDPSATTSRSNFQSILQNISPHTAQDTGNIDKSVSIPEVVTEPTTKTDWPLAQFKLGPPKLLTPGLSKPQLPPAEVNEPKIDVKTPSLLNARRIDIANDVSVRLDQKASVGTVHELIRNAGERHGVDPLLSMAVASAESGFDSMAISKDGFESKGVFQLLDQTAKQILQRQESDPKHYQPFNPQMNVDLGVRYLRHLHQVFSSETSLASNSKTIAAANSASLEKLAVAAFNAGEGRVAAAQHMAEKAGKNPKQFDDVESYLPETTQQYVRRVMLNKSRFEGGLRDS